MSLPTSLPTSLFAAPGVRAFGDAGRVPADDPEHAGLQIAYVARTAAMEAVRMPRFGFVTTINRKRGGGKAIRNAFLALRLVHVVDRPDMTAMIGLLLLDKDDLPLYYKGWDRAAAPICGREVRRV